MPRLVPGGPGRLDRLAPLLPSLEPPALQRQRPQHRPPRLAQVQVRRVGRLEHPLPPRIRPPQEQPIHRPVRRQVVDPRGAPLHLRRDPRLDPPWQVRPMGRVPAGGRGGQGRAGGRAEDADEGPRATPPGVDLWLGPRDGRVPPRGVLRRLGGDGLWLRRDAEEGLARQALG